MLKESNLCIPLITPKSRKRPTNLNETSVECESVKRTPLLNPNLFNN